MIIVQANPLNVTLSFDTIQAKALMHILRYVIDDPKGEAEAYTSKRMVETGLPVPLKDIFAMIAQIPVTLGRVMTEAEVLAEQKPKADEEDKPKTDKAKTKEGEWKN